MKLHTNLNFLIAIFVIIVLAGYLSYTYGVRSTKAIGVKPQATTDTKSQTNWIAPKSIIKNQQALAVGEIIKKDDTTITVKGEDNAQTTFKLASTLNISSISTSSATPPRKPTQDKADIKLNSKALITLEVKENGEYQVIDITFIPK